MVMKTVGHAGNNGSAVNMAVTLTAIGEADFESSFLQVLFPM